MKEVRVCSASHPHLLSNTTFETKTSGHQQVGPLYVLHEGFVYIMLCAIHYCLIHLISLHQYYLSPPSTTHMTVHDCTFTSLHLPSPFAGTPIGPPIPVGPPVVATVLPTRVLPPIIVQVIRNLFSPSRIQYLSIIDTVWCSATPC